MIYSGFIFNERNGWCFLTCALDSLFQPLITFMMKVSSLHSNLNMQCERKLLVNPLWWMQWLQWERFSAMSDEASIPDAVSHPAVPCHGAPSCCNSERRRTVRSRCYYRNGTCPLVMDTYCKGMDSFCLWWFSNRYRELSPCQTTHQNLWRARGISLSSSTLGTCGITFCSKRAKTVWRTWDLLLHWHSIVGFSVDFAGRLKTVFFLPLSLSLLFEWGDLWARELYRPMKSINETDLDFTYLLICIYGQRPTKAYHIYLYIATLSFHGIDFAYFFLLWTSPLPLHLTAKMGPGHVDPETRRRRRRSVIRWTEVNIRWTPGKQNVKVMRSLASPWSLMISWICILWSNMGYHDLSGFVFGKSSNKLCVEAFFTHSLDISLQMDFNDLRRSRWGECVKLPSLWLGPMRFLYFCGQEVLNTAVRCKDPI